ncbi:MAG: O-antigen ligase family protein, partial [Kiritimatiellaceae bacterium]|nr:O-antigen ligase family protein [Kiritimatiellaceae bacterium]
SDREIFWISLLVVMLAVALYSLAQHKTAPNLLFGVERYTTYWDDGRLGGTYQCPNHIAHLFQMWLPLCIVFLFIPQFSWFWRICFAYALPMFLMLIYQTQSRAGILGAVAALGTTFLLMLLRKSRRLFWIALLASPLLGFAVLGGLWTASPMFRDRMEPVISVLKSAKAGDWESVVAVDFRPQTWADTLTMIKDQPITGFGPGNYALIYEDYRHRCKAVRVETVHPHNEYLELLAEYGWIGCGLVLCILISVSIPLIRLIITAPRLYHAWPAVALLGAMAGTAVHGLFDFELHIFPNALMLALLAGCTVAPIVQTQIEKSASVPVKLWMMPLRILFFVFILGSSVWTVQVMSSAWMRAFGDEWFVQKKFARAEAFHALAQKIDPHNWQAYLGQGLIYYNYRYNELDPEKKHNWALKEQSAYASAYQINHKKEEVKYGLGRVELFLDHQDKGLDFLRKAANYKRFNDFYWRKLGIELRKAGLYEESLQAFETASKLNSSNPTTKRNISWLKAKLAATDGKK